MTQSVGFASKAAPICGVDDTEGTLKSIERLEQLAAWHRLNADHAGSDVWIWDARLRTAEDLERQAAQLRALLPNNGVNAGRCRQEGQAITNPPVHA